MDAQEMLLITRQAQINQQIEFAKYNLRNLLLALQMVEAEARRGRRDVIIPFMDQVLEDKLLERGFETRSSYYDPNLIEVYW
jgi:hypothetical protein